jgi:hypothetical protein
VKPVHWVLAVAAGMAVVALSAACDSDVELEPEALSEENFAERYAEAYCAAASCCPATASAPSCRQDFESQLAPEVARAQQLGLQFDGEAAAACLEAIRQNYEDCSGWKDTRPYFDVCARVYRDKPRAPGEACEGRWDCADSADAVGFCRDELDGEGPTCGLFRVAAEGEPCGNDYCDAGLFCYDNVCLSRFRAGEACVIDPPDGGDTCEPGFVCDRDETGVCVEARPLGASCDDELQCEDHQCSEGRCTWPGMINFAPACFGGI